MGIGGEGRRKKVCDPQIFSTQNTILKAPKLPPHGPILAVNKKLTLYGFVLAKYGKILNFIKIYWFWGIGSIFGPKGPK